MEGFIEIILENNASAASTEIRMGMKERSFPSIVMVGSKSTLSWIIILLLLLPSLTVMEDLVTSCVSMLPLWSVK